MDPQTTWKTTLSCVECESLLKKRGSSDFFLSIHSIKYENDDFFLNETSMSDVFVIHCMYLIMINRKKIINHYWGVNECFNWKYIRNPLNINENNASNQTENKMK